MAIGAIEQQAMGVNMRLAAEPTRWMRVTAPVWAWECAKPACVIRKVDVARWMICNTGKSRGGGVASRYRSGMGNDTTHWRTGTWGMQIIKT